MILLGDCLERLKELEENSVDAVVTDPPYGWRFMGKAWDGEDIEKMFKRDCAEGDKKLRPAHAAGKYNQSLEGNEAFCAWTEEYGRELIRVMKPGAHALVFCGPRTYHAMAMGIERAGFEIRDQLQWVFGSGFPKSHNGMWGGTALKPANEPILLSRKPLSEKTVKANFEKWGVGGLHIDASRIIGADQNSYAKNWDRNTVPDIRGGNYSNDNGARISNAKDAPAGRWPANLLLDETAAQMLDEQSGYSSEKARTCKIKSNDSIGTFKTKARETKVHGDSGGASRFFKVIEDDKCEVSNAADADLSFGKEHNSGRQESYENGSAQHATRFQYVAKASKRERNAGLEGMPEKPGGTLAQDKWSQENFGNSGTGRVRANHHPTVKPIKLMEYLCKLITPSGGVILDPFCGSGSTGVAAFKNNFKFIGIEMNEEYCAIAEKRIAHVSSDE